MSALTVLERPDGGRFQVTSGASDLGAALRYLMFSVPETNDSVRLDWGDDDAFTAGGTVPVSLRIGTLPPQAAVMTQYAITSHTPPEPRFGPNGDAILQALAYAYLPFVEAHPQVLKQIEAKVPKWHWVLQGKVPKSAALPLADAGPAPAEQADPTDEAMTSLASAIAQYAAVGSSLGQLITRADEGAAVGAALGAAAGAAAYLVG